MLQINKIHTGDSLDLLNGVDDNCIDFHMTSPMYADMKAYETSNGVLPDDYVEWIMPFIKGIERTMKSTGNFILNINDRVVDGFRHPYVYDLISTIHKETSLKMAERLFWNKGKYLPNRSRFGDKIEYLFWFCKSEDRYFDINQMRRPYSEVSLKRMKKPIKKRFNRTAENQDASEYKKWVPNEGGALPSTLIDISSCAKRMSEIHTAVYPEELVEYFMKGMSREGDLACDIFSGSGTTCRGAKRLNRNYLGMELSQKYNDEAIPKLT
jgi:site-specific DNA-methyltransferase (adenine-specific)